MLRVRPPLVRQMALRDESFEDHEMMNEGGHLAPPAVTPQSPRPHKTDGTVSPVPSSPSGNTLSIPVNVTDMSKGTTKKLLDKENKKT